MQATDPHSEEKFEKMLANLLRGGVLLAAAVVSLGAILFLARHGGEVHDYSVFRGEPADLRDPRRIGPHALELSGRGVIQLGLLLLLATPVARVLLSAIGFVRQRDWLYVALTLTVLALLLASLLA